METLAKLKIQIPKFSNYKKMKSQLLYISIIEQNLERFEAKVKQEGTVSEKLKDYIDKKKGEISEMKNRLLAKA